MKAERNLAGAAFGQADPTDNRERGDWDSKYSPEALKKIRAEAIYLGVLLFAAPVVMLVMWLGWPQSTIGMPPFRYRVILKFALAWAAGTLGGVLYDLKWLYHVVARQLWHMDRRLWRVFIPHISGGVAFGTIALMESDLVRIFDHAVITRSSAVVGIGFLIGYFSDSSMAKLAEVAETLFGTTRSREKHSSRGAPSGEGSD